MNVQNSPLVRTLRDAFGLKGDANVPCIALFLSLILTLTGCNGLHELELEEREQQSLKSRLEKLGTVQEHKRIFFVALDSVVGEYAEGDTLHLRYTLYALTSQGEIVVESNEPDIIAQHKLHPTDTQYPPQNYVLGKTDWLEGIARGLQYAAPRSSRGWLGIPHAQGYGNTPFGRIPSRTPLLFHYEITNPHP